MNALLPVEVHFTLQLWLGLTAAVLSFVAYIPYAIDTAAGRTRPQRASWLIWSVLSIIAFSVQFYEEASTSLWFAGSQAIASVLIFGLSLRKGTGSIFNSSDYITLVIAGVGVLLWYLTETAAYTLMITITISLLGGVATATKAWHDPESETLMTWVISLVASVLAILSVGESDLMLLAYPIYLLVLNLLLIGAILFGACGQSQLPQVMRNR